MWKATEWKHRTLTLVQNANSKSFPWRFSRPFWCWPSTDPFAHNGICMDAAWTWYLLFLALNGTFVPQCHHSEIKKEEKELKLFLFLFFFLLLPSSCSLKFVEGIRWSSCLILCVFQKAAFLCGTSHGASFFWSMAWMDSRRVIRVL